MSQLLPVDSPTDILPAYRGTSIELLLRYHNLGEPLPLRAARAELLVGMCMDHRKNLTIPNEFAFVLRAAGGNLRDHEFDISYAVAIGGITTVALLAHTDCGMAHLTEKRRAFVRGLVDRAGWSEADAVAHFDRCAPHYDLGDPLAFLRGESERIRRLYPGVLVAPLLYRVEDDRLAQVAPD